MGKLFGKKKKSGQKQQKAEPKTFFDCIAPTTIKFFANYCIVGDTYRCVWVIREYPPSTEEQAILSHLADHSGVTLRLYNRLVEAYEQRQIANNAARKNRLKLGDTDINESIQAEYDLIHSCERGHNLYRCGNERYLLQVIAPEHKVALFGNAGGR